MAAAGAVLACQALTPWRRMCTSLVASDSRVAAAETRAAAAEAGKTEASRYVAVHLPLSLCSMTRHGAGWACVVRRVARPSCGVRLTTPARCAAVTRPLWYGRRELAECKAHTQQVQQQLEATAAAVEELR